jgi:hypothetical protein
MDDAAQTGRPGAYLVDLIPQSTLHADGDNTAMH